MAKQFKKVSYSKLNARQKEMFNFQLISGFLATYGYHTHRVPDDWEGADFIARHVISREQIQVQLKGRIHFARKYRGKNIWIAFRNGDHAYLFPHDQLLKLYMKVNPMRINKAWHRKDGAVHWRRPTKVLLGFLEDYRLDGQLR